MAVPPWTSSSTLDPVFTAPSSSSLDLPTSPPPLAVNSANGRPDELDSGWEGGERSITAPTKAYGVDGNSHGRRESDFEPVEDDLDDFAAGDSAVMARLNQQIVRRGIGALACACLLSIGSYVLFFPSSTPFLAHSRPANSHYSTYTLGPIKKDLHTSEGHFAALLSALELASTLTPLLSGILIPRFGAAAVGLVATGAIFIGQLIVCAAFSREGGVNENLGAMVRFLLLFF
jgi:hypothetical protein